MKQLFLFYYPLVLCAKYSKYLLTTYVHFELFIWLELKKVLHERSEADKEKGATKSSTFFANVYRLDLESAVYVQILTYIFHNIFFPVSITSENSEFDLKMFKKLCYMFVSYTQVLETFT